MVYKNISSKAILAKIYRDFKPGYAGWEADAIEWIGEALDYIGCCSGFEMHSEDIQVKNFRAPLPANFYTLRGVDYLGDKLPFGGSSSAGYNLFALEVLPSGQKDARDTIRVINPGSYSGDYYIINPSYIQTSFESGTITVKYYRYPIDAEGLPLVPDNIYVKKALSWYVAMMMKQGGQSLGDFTFRDAMNMWGHACIQAQNDCMFPSPDKAERFRDMWVRMIPTEGYNSDPGYELDYDNSPVR
jgi:hypothetical protein